MFVWTWLGRKWTYAVPTFAIYESYTTPFTVRQTNYANPMWPSETEANQAPWESKQMCQWWLCTSFEKDLIPTWLQSQIAKKRKKKKSVLAWLFELLYTDHFLLFQQHQVTTTGTSTVTAYDCHVKDAIKISSCWQTRRCQGHQV